MKILCMMDNGFEELEAVGTIALLRRAGITIDVAAVNGHEATGRFALTFSDLKALMKWILMNMTVYSCLADRTTRRSSRTKR